MTHEFQIYWLIILQIQSQIRLKSVSNSNLSSWQLKICKLSIFTLFVSVWLSPPSFSPSGKKFRSKPQLSRYLGNTVDLGCFDFRTGKMMPGKLQKNKQRLRHDPLSLSKVTLMDHTCKGGLWLGRGSVVCYQIIRLMQRLLQQVISSAGQWTNTHSLKRRSMVSPSHGCSDTDLSQCGGCFDSNLTRSCQCFDSHRSQSGPVWGLTLIKQRQVLCAFCLGLTQTDKSLMDVLTQTFLCPLSVWLRLVLVSSWIWLEWTWLKPW